MGSVTSVRVKWNLFFPFWRVFRKVHSMEKIHRWRDHLWFSCLYTALILGAAPSRYFWSSNCMEVTHLKDGEKRRHNFNYIFPITNRLISNTRKHLQMMDQSTDSFIWITFTSKMTNSVVFSILWISMEFVFVVCKIQYGIEFYIRIEFIQKILQPDALQIVSFANWKFKTLKEGTRGEWIGWRWQSAGKN